MTLTLAELGIEGELTVENTSVVETQEQEEEHFRQLRSNYSELLEVSHSS